METKVCRDCQMNKKIDEFRKNSRQCRKCEAISKKDYYLRTREHKLQYTKEYMKQNQDYYKQYREEHKTKMKQYNQEYYKNNKPKLIQYNVDYEKRKSKQDNLYRIKRQARKMIYNSFYRLKYDKKKKTELITGININDLINYLLQTYKDNYGVEWDGIEPVHIDHKTPLATAKTEEDVITLCHYTNLQLLKEKDNLEKSFKLDWELSK